MFLLRTLSTPTEDNWPGVTQLQDYKANFPKWTDFNLANSVKQMDADGLDLLTVRRINNDAVCCEDNFVSAIFKHFFNRKAWLRLILAKLGC